jgi:hypothetical protein
MGACMLSMGPVPSLGLTGPNKGLWVVGFLISVIFSFLAALGINMQKQSIREHAAQNPSLPTWRQPVLRLWRVCGHTTSQGGGYCLRFFSHLRSATAPSPVAGLYTALLCYPRFVSLCL